MKLERVEGCWTAMITPFNRKGEIDFEGLERTFSSRLSTRRISFLREQLGNLPPWTGESMTG